MLKYVLRAVYCLFLGRLWRQSQYISSMSEAQGGGHLPWAVPAEHDSSSGARASSVKVETELQRVVDLLMNYICLIFTSTVC